MNWLLGALDLSAALAVGIALLAEANAFDASQLLCRESTEMDEDGIVVILLSMDGYLSSDVTGDARFNPDSMQIVADKVCVACSNSPASPPAL